MGTVNKGATLNAGYNLEATRELILAPIFESDNVLGRVSTALEIPLYDVAYNVKEKRKFKRIGKMGPVSKARTNCSTWNPTVIQTSVDSEFSVHAFEVEAEMCADEFTGIWENIRGAGNNMNSTEGELAAQLEGALVDRIKSSMKDDIFRQVWFSETAFTTTHATGLAKLNMNVRTVLETQMSQFNGFWPTIETRVTASQIAYVDSYNGATRYATSANITAWLEKIIEKLKSMSAEDRELAVTVGLIAAAIGPALIAVGFMLKAVAGVIVVIKAAVLVFSALTAGIGGLVVGLAALGAASYLIGKHWLGLGQIGEWLGQKIWDAWEAIPGLVGSATASLADFGVAFKDQALSWYNYFVGLFEKAFSWFGDKISWVTDKFNAVKGWMPGGGGKVDGERARGGRVNTGGSYLVGERGPEIFAPDMSGRIIPNNDIEGGGASAKTLSNIETLLLEMREALI